MFVTSQHKTDCLYMLSFSSSLKITTLKFKYGSTRKRIEGDSQESNLLGKDCKEVHYFMCLCHIYLNLAINLTVKYSGTIHGTCAKFAKRTDSTYVHTR